MRLDGMLVNTGEGKAVDYLRTLPGTVKEAVLYFFWIWSSNAEVRHSQRRKYGKH